MSYLQDFLAALPREVDKDKLLRLAPDALWQHNPQLAAIHVLSRWGRIDTGAYMRRYPDVAASRFDPVEHFARHGIAEKRIIEILRNEENGPIPGMDNSPLGPPSYSIIITAGKCKNNVGEQYLAIKKQSIKPLETIWLTDGAYISPEYIRSCTDPEIRIVHCPLNSARTPFALACGAKGKYVGVLGGDIIPGEFWFANAIRVCESYDAFVAGSGRLYDAANHGSIPVCPETEGSFGGVSCCDNDVFCDWGVGSYLFKRAWLGSLLGDEQMAGPSLTSVGMLPGLSLFNRLGVRSIVPMQPQTDKRLHASVKQELYERASLEPLTPDEESLIKEQLTVGYTPVLDRDNLITFWIIISRHDAIDVDRCLLSIKAQIYENYHCVVVDERGTNAAGPGASAIIARLGLDSRHFTFARPHEVAGYLAKINPADVAIHLDGGDWLAHSHVLAQLNRVYRQGQAGEISCAMASYTGNKAEGMGAYEPYAAPLRTFQARYWPDLWRRLCSLPSRVSLQQAPCPVVTISMPEVCQQSRILSNLDISCICKAGSEESRQERLVSLWNILNLAECGETGCFGAQTVPVKISSNSDALDTERMRDPGYVDFLGSEPIKTIHGHSCAIATVITSDYIPEGIISLGSYMRNCRQSLEGFIFIGSDNPNVVKAARRILGAGRIKPLFPEDLRYTEHDAERMAVRYKFGTDAYRWGMKAVVLRELLERGYTCALFLDPDMYTVADISDVQQAIMRHPISVFPHFRNPDGEKTRKFLYSDGFFNGGMLGACQTGIKGIAKLVHLCQQEVTVDYARHLYVDQKYFDRFVVESPNLYVNLDKGVNYNTWNDDPVHGLVAPTERSYLQYAGSFSRLWHMNNGMLRDAANKFGINVKTIPVCAIYVLSKLFAALLLMIKLWGDEGAAILGISGRFKAYADVLTRISDYIPLKKLMDLSASSSVLEQDELLGEWASCLRESVCWDNYALFAMLLDELFLESASARNIAAELRQSDFRWLAENQLGSPLGTCDKASEILSWERGKEIFANRLEQLKKIQIDC